MLCGGMSQPKLAEAALVWGWWCPFSVDAGGELVGVGVQRCQQRDVVVFRAAGAAPVRRLLRPGGRVRGGGSAATGRQGAGASRYSPSVTRAQTSTDATRRLR